MTLVDTNGLLDLVTDDPDWAEWSIVKLEETAIKGALAINDVVCAELSIRYGRIEDLEAMHDDAAIADAVGRAFPRRQGLGAVWQVGRRTNWRPSGFFYPRPRRGKWADARRRTLSHLFPGHGPDRA